jgi:hypothetical protein
MNLYLCGELKNNNNYGPPILTTGNSLGDKRGNPAQRLPLAGGYVKKEKESVVIRITIFKHASSIIFWR